MPHSDLPPKNLDLQKALHQERHLLQKAQVPIITVSATFRKELLKKYRSLARGNTEAVFSRAHYSMAEAVRQQALKSKLTTHLVDPTNFVSHQDWSKIDFTEHVGQLMARHKPLKWLKDQVDTIARNKLPISEAITPPLLYLTEKITRPIISLHYEAGNIVCNSGKTVLQMLTDPHVRPQYLDPLPILGSSSDCTCRLHFAVFDHKTKQQLLSAASELGKIVSPSDITVTGPPVDPRICALFRRRRELKAGQPLHLGITTGGLGTNLNEIKQVLYSLAPLLNPPEHLRLFLHAGTHRDFRNFFEAFAADHNIRIGNLDDTKARIRILYEDSIIDANQNLIHYMFPWAHGIITKPSGDMAYDAAAAGCFLLFLEPWGDWEQNIQNRFTHLKVGYDLHTRNANHHLSYLLRTRALSKALTCVHRLPPLFRSGTTNLLRLHTKLAHQT